MLPLNMSEILYIKSTDTSIPSNVWGSVQGIPNNREEFSTEIGTQNIMVVIQQPWNIYQLNCAIDNNGVPASNWQLVPFANIPGTPTTDPEGNPYRYVLRWASIVDIDYSTAHPAGITPKAGDTALVIKNPLVVDFMNARPDPRNYVTKPWPNPRVIIA